MRLTGLDLALVQCPVWAVNMPPMTLAMISSFLRKNNISTRIFDINIEEYHRSEDKGYWINEKAHFWMEKEKYEILLDVIKPDFEETAKKILEHRPKAIGFSISDASKHYSYDLMKAIKKASDVPIIAGGKGIWLKTERDFFEDAVDFFVMGEGEKAILELITKIKNKLPKKSLRDTSGVRAKGAKFKAMPLIDLHELPFPDYKEFDLSRYTERTIGLLFSKGCVGRCNFCEDKPFQGYYRTRDPKRVFEEIKYHVNANKVRNFWFHDLAINGDYKALEEFCELIILEKLDIKWIALAIARKDMPRELLFKMKKAGCFTLNFGIETGSDSVLKKMNKYELFSVKDAERVIKDTWEAGINTQLNFIVGYPGETEEEFIETMDFIERNRKYICGITNINTCIIPLNSPLRHTSETKDLEVMDWKLDNLSQEVRIDRAKRVYELCRKLGYDIWFSNLSQQKEGNNDLINKEKNQKITLINMPPWGTKELPMALGYISSYLKEKNIDVEVLDLNSIFYFAFDYLQWMWEIDFRGIWYNKESLSLILKSYEEIMNQTVDKIIDSGTSLIGFSVVDSKEPLTIELIKKIKEKAHDIKIVIGGPSARDKIERQHLKEIYPLISCFVVGEGEETFHEIIKKDMDRAPLTDIPGTIAIVDGKEIENGPRPEMDIEKIIFPKYEQFDMGFYSRTIPLSWSRGCTNKCVFCVEREFWSSFRTRNPKHCFEEIEFHYLKGFSDFVIHDSIINGDIVKLRALLELLINSKMKIRWRANVVAWPNLNEMLFKKMKLAGCYELLFGIESGSDKILRLMKKGYNAKQASKLLELCHNSGIKTCVNFISGFPGETEKDHAATLDFIEKNKKVIGRIGGVSTLQVLNGTYLGNNLEKYNVEKTDANYGNMWKTKKNDFNVRRKRVNSIMDLAEKLGISIERANTLTDTSKFTEMSIRRLKKCIEKRSDTIRYMDSNKTDIASKTIREFDAILIIGPPWGVSTPPIGINYLKNYLASKGLRIEIKDLNISLFNYDEKYKKYWSTEYRKWTDVQQFKEVIRLFEKKIDVILPLLTEKSDVFGFSAYQDNINFIIYLSKRIKQIKPNSKIVVGGPSTKVHRECKKFQKPFIDFIIIGDGEESFHELLTAINSGIDEKQIRNIPGVLVPGHNENFQERTPIELDKIANGFAINEEYIRKGSASIFLSKGCPGICTFCNDYIIMGKFRTRSAKDVYLEMKEYTKRGIFNFIFTDLLINANPSELDKLCEYIIENELPVKWDGNAIAMSNLTFERLRKMKKAGCESLTFGIESGSDRVIKDMKKYFTADLATTILDNSKKAGITNKINLIVGYPTEKEEDFLLTIKFLERNKKNIDEINSANTCNVVYNSDLMDNHFKYGIKLPKDTRFTEVFWRTLDNKNNIFVRKKRLRKLLDKCRELNKKVKITNINSFSENLKSHMHEIKYEKEAMLILCPPWDTNMPPLGLGYLAASLEKKGIPFRIFDLNIEMFNSANPIEKNLWEMQSFSKWKFFSTHKEIIKKNRVMLNNMMNAIKIEKPILICFSVNAANQHFTVAIMKSIKKHFPEVKIAIGGPNIDTDYILKDEMMEYCDYAINGEGEEAIPRIIDELKTEKKRNSKLESAEIISDLDSLAFPTYNGFMLSKYKKRAIPIIGSRGCIRKCSFCSDWKMGKEYRTRSAQNIFNEIKHHVKANKITHFEFKDLLINGNMKVLDELCSIIIGSGLKMSWTGQGIARKEMTPEFLNRMKKAGFEAMTYGVESFSDKTLSKMKKGTTIKIIDNVLKDTYAAGINVYINIIVGFPNETEEEFIETMDYIEKNRKLFKGISSLLPLGIYGNSDIHLNPEEYGIIYPKQDFNNWLDEGGFISWSDLEGNGFNIRMQRLARISKLLDNLGIPYPKFDFHSYTRLKEEYHEKMQKHKIATKTENIHEINKNNKLLTGAITQKTGLQNSLFELSLLPYRTRARKVIDSIEFGIKESEDEHELLGAWSSIFSGSKANWRGFFGECIMRLHIEKKEYFKEAIDLTCEIEIQDMPLTNTDVFSSYDGRLWFKIGEIPSSGQPEFRKHSFKINSQILRPEFAYVKISTPDKERFRKIRRVSILRE